MTRSRYLLWSVVSVVPLAAAVVFLPEAIEVSTTAAMGFSAAILGLTLCAKITWLDIPRARSIGWSAWTAGWWLVPVANLVYQACLLLLPRRANPATDSNERCIDHAVAELQSNRPSVAAWARALVIANGDARIARTEYIRIRALALAASTQERSVAIEASQHGAASKMVSGVVHHRKPRELPFLPGR